MNQLINPQSGGSQPQIILVNVLVTQLQSEIKLQANIDPEIPFNTFIAGIKQQIFAQKMQAQYEDTIEYLLEKANIQNEETRTLKNLGFTNNCTLLVKLKYKGG